MTISKLSGNNKKFKTKKTYFLKKRQTNILSNRSVDEFISKL
jgi:hypothetical protein